MQVIRKDLLCWRRHLQSEEHVLSVTPARRKAGLNDLVGFIFGIFSFAVQERALKNKINGIEITYLENLVIKMKGPLIRVKVKVLKISIIVLPNVTVKVYAFWTVHNFVTRQVNDIMPVLPHILRERTIGILVSVYSDFYSTNIQVNIELSS